MRKRMNHVSSVCKRCGLEKDTVEHMLSQSHDSQIIWKMNPIIWNDLDNISGFSLWWNDKINMAKTCSSSAGVLNLTVMIMWHIWKSRNAWCFNNELTDPSDIVAKDLFEYNKYLEIILAESSTGNVRENNEYQGTVPQEGICFFFDAGLQVESKKASVGLVAIVSKGVLLHAYGSPIQCVGKSMIAEAFAISKAVETAILNG
ncbi:uncharacterized protein LOC132047870 [Lycium ferocissimum]|uniref:uncharacterized protein LOC132047870 n=1 Tax=Lycium ferocissimum TaxID=112874 RepID=UPI002815D12E|nr:uncharacterized protein LOC132047870 [Lycium ferocissimum]